MNSSNLLQYHVIAKNAGAHNSIYRGKDITDLFYDGTLSKQIAAATFDDIFIGDYIIGSSSVRKYLVADIDYWYMYGDTALTTHHVVIVPEYIVGSTKQMNASNTTSGAYIGSAMNTANLDEAKNIIISDFTNAHLKTHRQFLSNAVTRRV